MEGSSMAGPEVDEADVGAPKKVAQRSDDDTRSSAFPAPALAAEPILKVPTQPDALCRNPEHRPGSEPAKRNVQIRAFSTRVRAKFRLISLHPAAHDPLNRIMHALAIDRHSRVWAWGPLCQMGGCAPASVLLDLLRRRAEPGLKVQVLGQRVTLVQIDQPWGEVGSCARTCLPGTGSWNFLYHTEIVRLPPLRHHQRPLSCVPWCSHCHTMQPSGTSRRTCCTGKGSTLLILPSIDIVPVFPGPLPFDLPLIFPWPSACATAWASLFPFSIVLFANRIRYFADLHGVRMRAHLFNTIKNCRLGLWTCAITVGVQHQAALGPFFRPASARFPPSVR